MADHQLRSLADATDEMRQGAGEAWKKTKDTAQESMANVAHNAGHASQQAKDGATNIMHQAGDTMKSAMNKIGGDDQTTPS